MRERSASGIAGATACTARNSTACAGMWMAPHVNRRTFIARVREVNAHPFGHLRANVAAWIEAGVQLVSLIDAQHRVATVHRADGTSATRAAAEALDGESLLPGFSILLRRLFGD